MNRPPRRTRWLSIPALAELMAKRTSAVAEELKTKSRKRQLETIRRMVDQVERRDETRLTKRIGRAVYVRFDALESLLPVDVETVTRLEVAVVDVVAETKHIVRIQKDHYSRLREHGRRIRSLEEEQEVTTAYLAKLQEIRSRSRAAS